MRGITFDLEANNLLNGKSIDYTASPYKLKDNFKLHCIVVEDLDTRGLIAFYDGPTYILDGREYVEELGGHTFELSDYEPVEYEHRQLKEFVHILDELDKDYKVIGHNIINYDLLVLKLWFGIDYEVEQDKWGGKRCCFEDTMVTSYLLNPDRFGGHSLDLLSKRAGGHEKLEFRKHIPADQRFEYFAADMLYYNIKDVQSNTDVYYYLENEKGDWDWRESIKLEKAVAEIVTRSEHRGFAFNEKLARDNIAKLDALMEERRQRVEPLLPPRPATKKFLSDHTPPKSQQKVTELRLPKSLFKKNGDFTVSLVKFAEKHDLELEKTGQATGRIKCNGKWFAVKPELLLDTIFELSSNMERFLEKHNGVANKIIVKANGAVIKANTRVKLYGKVYQLPMAIEPIKTEMVATIDDTTHIKAWIVKEFGWQPLEYKEKDISVNSKKEKRTEQELMKAIDDYHEETVNSPFCNDRLEPFEANIRNFKIKLFKQATKRGCKVRTNPSFTVGQEKNMCPNLELIADKFPYAKDIVEYLTYKHRRNSILGGGLSWLDLEEEEAERGYLAILRSDGRVPTSAITCGTPTGRMKHRGVANIPRISSAFGAEMRALFGVNFKNYVQCGYDFDSLEARIEAHHCWDLDDKEHSYCKSLLLPKPNDTHSKMAAKVTDLLGRDFDRAPAKSVRYGCSYGAQPPKVAKTIGCSLEEGKLIFNTFWDLAKPLDKLKKKLMAYWESTSKKHLVGLDGRKIMTRHAHAIINSQFQADGVICAKRTMVIHDRLLKKEGLLCDFFVDDWKSKQFCQQMIAYHDEAQLEISKGLVKVKAFGMKADAIIFTEHQEGVWSEPFKSKDKWLVGYSRPAELISKAVEKTNQHFKLNVPLTAGYILGKNWADCH